MKFRRILVLVLGSHCQAFTKVLCDSPAQSTMVVGTWAVLKGVASPACYSCLLRGPPWFQA